jgi:hypothetical protein
MLRDPFKALVLELKYMIHLQTLATVNWQMSYYDLQKETSLVFGIATKQLNIDRTL